MKNQNLISSPQAKGRPPSDGIISVVIVSHRCEFKLYVVMDIESKVVLYHVNFIMPILPAGREENSGGGGYF